MGNAVADEAAKLACNSLHRPITSDLRRLFSDAISQQQSLAMQYALRVDLVLQRVKLDNEYDKAPERQLERLEQMHSYTPDQGHRFLLTADDFLNVRGSKFGRRLTDLILKWLQLLEWPTSPEEVTPPVGITWVEMAVNFMLCSQATIPALPAHLQRIKPKFFSKVGTIVPPLQLVKHLPKESQAGIIDTWSAKKRPTRLKARI
eukprot:s820_g10.t1